MGSHLLLPPRYLVPRIKGAPDTVASVVRTDVKAKEEEFFARMHVRIVENWSARAGIVDDQTKVVQRDGSRFFF